MDDTTFESLRGALAAGPDNPKLLVPEWTKHTVERIFATHLEDWPALLRSMRQVGEDVLLSGYVHEP